jgi:hypothetical protein
MRMKKYMILGIAILIGGIVLAQDTTKVHVKLKDGTVLNGSVERHYASKLLFTDWNGQDYLIGKSSIQNLKQMHNDILINGLDQMERAWPSKPDETPGLLLQKGAGLQQASFWVGVLGVAATMGLALATANDDPTVVDSGANIPVIILGGAVTITSAGLYLSGLSKNKRAGRLMDAKKL